MFCSLKIRRFAFVKQIYVSQIYLIADSKKKKKHKKEGERNEKFIYHSVYLFELYLLHVQMHLSTKSKSIMHKLCSCSWLISLSCRLLFCYVIDGGKYSSKQQM